ncbi:MAG: 50S ribosomal protein L5 [Nanoarchaeota archaeon]|nr:50S ribosomal protein L5 [Nanoarchaeota archaeon]MBU1135258.1 50S ribosomal protein L5 [Nanoarchaeota archaeon]MBU2519892.1 50S ribosomal protein L5 [Nanoarchaeota archaeon]
MKNIELEKVTLNLSAGEAGPKLEKSQKMLENITGKKVVITKTHKRSTFGVAKGRPIGVKVTIRKGEARELLKKLLGAVDNKIKPSSFDNQGNFSFGIHEYINIPGVNYDPDIGILGMDVCITLKRPGFRVKNRRLNKNKIGIKHNISKEESINFAKNEFGVKLTEDEE